MLQHRQLCKDAAQLVEIGDLLAGQIERFGAFGQRSAAIFKRVAVADRQPLIRREQRRDRFRVRRIAEIDLREVRKACFRFADHVRRRIGDVRKIEFCRVGGIHIAEQRNRMLRHDRREQLHCSLDRVRLQRAEPHRLQIFEVRRRLRKRFGRFAVLALQNRAVGRHKAVPDLHVIGEDNVRTGRGQFRDLFVGQRAVFDPDRADRVVRFEFIEVRRLAHRQRRDRFGRDLRFVDLRRIDLRLRRFGCNCLRLRRIRLIDEQEYHGCESAKQQRQCSDEKDPCFLGMFHVFFRCVHAFVQNRDHGKPDREQHHGAGDRNPDRAVGPIRRGSGFVRYLLRRRCRGRFRARRFRRHGGRRFGRLRRRFRRRRFGRFRRRRFGRFGRRRLLRLVERDRRRIDMFEHVVDARIRSDRRKDEPKFFLTAFVLVVAQMIPQPLRLVALIRLLRDLKSRAPVECGKRLERGDEDRVLRRKVQVQLFHLPHAVLRNGLRIVCGVGGALHRRARCGGDDHMLPVPVFSVVVMRNHDLWFHTAQITHQRQSDVLRQEIFFLLLAVLDGNVGQSRHQRIGPQSHDPCAVQPFRPADARARRKPQDRARIAAFRAVGRDHVSHEQRVVVRMHGDHQKIDLVKRRLPRMIVLRRAARIRDQRAQLRVAVRGQAHAVYAFRDLDAVVPEASALARFHRVAGRVEQFDRVRRRLDARFVGPFKVYKIDGLIRLPFHRNPFVRLQNASRRFVAILQAVHARPFSLVFIGAFFGEAGRLVRLRCRRCRSCARAQQHQRKHPYDCIFPIAFHVEIPSAYYNTIQKRLSIKRG